MAETQPRRRDGLTEAPIDGELVVYAPELGRAVLLNPSAAAIWQRCDGNRSVAAIGREVAAVFGLPAAAILDDVVAALAELAKLGLIAWAAEPSGPIVASARQ